MTDPYTEVSRREGRSGLSGLGWVFVVLGACFTLGLVGLTGLGFFFAKKASSVLADFRERPVEAFVDLAQALGEDVEVVSANEEDGTVLLRVRDTDDLVTVDLSQVPQMLGGEPSPGVRVNGEADESGGILTIVTPEGETRIELRGGDEGGFLRISTPDDDVHLGAGLEAGDLPGWVPVYPGARVHKRLFSATTDEGLVGAVLLRVDDTPRAVLDWYGDTMPDGGFVASGTRVHADDGSFRGKVEWTLREGGDEREVSVAVGTDDDGEGFLFLFYRDER